MPLVRVKGDVPLVDYPPRIRLAPDEEGRERHLTVGDDQYTEVSRADLQALAGCGYEIEIRQDDAESVSEEPSDSGAGDQTSRVAPAAPEPQRSTTFPPGQPSSPPPSSSSE